MALSLFLIMAGSAVALLSALNARWLGALWAGFSVLFNTRGVRRGIKFVFRLQKQPLKLPLDIHFTVIVCQVQRAQGMPLDEP